MKNLSTIFILIFSFSISLICLAVEKADPKEAEKPVEVKETNDVKEQVITNSIGMKLRLIEPGEFMMGSEKGDKDEKPVHKVKITKPFYIGIYEVTQAQYEEIMGTNPYRFSNADRAVERVSWNDAKEFCKKLSQKEGVTYRLPTEAEWEYACRAGTKTEYYWGDSMDGKYAVYRDNSGDETQNVGTKEPNKWGLYDMSGNVWEWCEDWYGGIYSGGEETDPIGATRGEIRVFRGGSRFYPPETCRSAYRAGGGPTGRWYSFGFRVVRSTSKHNENENTNDLVITITKEKEVFFQGNRISEANDYKELRQIFSEMTVSNEDNIRLIIRADRETPFGKVMEIWNIAVLEGIDNIAFAAEHAEEKDNE